MKKKVMKTTPTLSAFVLKEIFKYLDLAQRSRCARVCKSWYEAERCLQIDRLRLHVGMLKGDVEPTEFLLAKSDEQLKKVFRAPKLENLKALDICTFKNSPLRIPVIDLGNFKNLRSLELSGFHFENDIFMVLLQQQIRLEKLETLSAPYVHLNIVNLVAPNLKRIRSACLLMPVFRGVEKPVTWTEFDHRGIEPLSTHIFHYLSMRAFALEVLTLTVSSLSFIVENLKKFANLKRLNLNILPSHFASCLDEFHALLSSINENALTLRINGLPVHELEAQTVDGLRAFVDQPFRTTYQKLNKNLILPKDDLRYFFDNFSELKIVEHTSSKIKSLKRFSLNNVTVLKYKADENAEYLFSKFFVKVPNLERLELSEVANLEQSQFDLLPVLWPNLMSINLSSTSMRRLDLKFVESFKCLCAIHFENLNFLNDACFQFVVNRAKFLNQLITVNCRFNQKKTFDFFMKKINKHPSVEFNIKINDKFQFTSPPKWGEFKSGPSSLV